MLKNNYRKFRLSESILDKTVEDIFKDVDLETVLLKNTFVPPPLKVGDIVSGQVINFVRDTALVDIGRKVEGYLPIEEDIEEDLDIGDFVRCLVSKVDNTGKISLTREDVDLVETQKEALQGLAEGDRVKAFLLERNSSGWLAEVSGAAALLPANQEFLFYPDSDPDIFCNTTVEAEIEKIDGMSITLTRKPFSDQVRKLSKEHHFSKIQLNDILNGVVKNVTDFGAFINVGNGIVGLCYNSDFGDTPPQVNQNVKVMVTKVDSDKNRVCFGIRQVTEPSWKDLTQDLTVGLKVTAEVKSLVPYGAFLELPNGVNGLLHISDFSWSSNIKQPQDLLKEGEKIEVVILDIDNEKRHVSFGLKQVSQDPWETAKDRYLIGSTVSGVITATGKFGIFVQLEPGLEGLAWHTDKSLSVGSAVEVIINRIDVVNKRISLKIK